MKKTLFIIAIISLGACTNEAKKEVPVKTTVICDSISESNYDSLGNEIIKYHVKCDTIIETKTSE